jgi:hypothetical protein
MNAGMADAATGDRQVAIMQPYFFPYLGYFQLIAASDAFLVLDDAKYAKHAWINRNRLLLDGAPHWFTLPVATASHLAPINARRFRSGRGDRERVLAQLENAYRRAPRFAETFALVEGILADAEDNVAAFNTRQLRTLAQVLGIATPILVASELPDPPAGAGQERVLALCERLGADRYVNSIGGVALYAADAFAARGIELRFLQSQAPAYAQLGAPFVPALSIIDVLMFNDVATVRGMLEQFTLLRAAPAAAD